MNTQNTTCIPCGIRAFTRNTYFNGKLLVERDFESEQAYMVGKDRLHNSMLHGAGTVCGLKVQPHPNPECQDSYVYIDPGMALDCCGRELIVANKLRVPVLELIQAADVSVDDTGTYDLFIALCYAEDLDEKIPVILPTCDCADTDQAYNRIREGVKVQVFSRLAGERQSVRQPLSPTVEWLHTLTLPLQSPRAFAADDVRGQLYVAAQAIGGGDEPVAARVYVYDSLNHDLLTAVNGGDEPTDLALSLLGDRIYLASGGLAHQGDPETLTTGIAVFREAEMRDSPNPAAIIRLGGPNRLLVSPHTGELLALQLDTGVLRSWSNDAIDAWLGSPTPDPAGPALRAELTLDTTFDAVDGPARRGSAMMTITPDGRYLFLADQAGNKVRVVDLATFTEIFRGDVTPRGAGDVPRFQALPVALGNSLDDEYLFVLWAGHDADAGNAFLTRYRIDTSDTFTLRLAGRVGRWLGTAHDFALAPRERWGYSLQTFEDQAMVQALLIDNMDSPSGDDPFDPRVTAEPISGDARFQRLALGGGRLYVTANDEASGPQPERGLVAVLNVSEDACEQLFDGAIEGCPSCTSEEDHCVILASIPEYRLNGRIVLSEEAGDTDNILDNITHRPLVPSSNNIVEVIRCMLDQGFAEGIPGPRGPAGEQGVRGPTITEVETSTLAPGSAATATLQDIPGDPEGDQRLLLGIPSGPAGPAGPRGPGITQVQVTTLDPGSAATATLQNIPGDPEGDQRLLLGIPRGAPGQSSEDPELTHIIGLSWLHGMKLTAGELQDMMIDPIIDDPNVEHSNTGLVLLFDREVQMNTVFLPAEAIDDQIKDMFRSEVFQLFARTQDQRAGLFCECLIANATYQPVQVLEQDDTGRITKVVPIPDAPVADAVRLVFDSEHFPPVFDTNSLFLRILLRADFVLDTQDPNPRAVDGNFAGGLLPTGNGRQGDSFESWLYVVEG